MEVYRGGASQQSAAVPSTTLVASRVIDEADRSRSNDGVAEGDGNHAERIKMRSLLLHFRPSQFGLVCRSKRTAIEALGCPFATLMEKCVIDESHSQFAGMYAGAVSEAKTRQIVEGADLVLDWRVI